MKVWNRSFCHVSNLRRLPEVATFELRSEGLSGEYVCRKIGKGFQGEEIACVAIQWFRVSTIQPDCPGSNPGSETR